MGGWMNAWTDDGNVEEAWMMSRSVRGWMDRWMDGWTDRSIDDCRANKR